MRSPHDASILNVRVVTDPKEIGWFDTQLADHHYLGAGRAVGDYLRQVVEVSGQLAALLVWGPACYALKDRDLWISWTAVQRVQRLKLIVQNRRFLVLVPKGQHPNLASQAMGAALRALPEQWREQFGYRPLLAESFTDPEAYAGTCYKASNWEPIGWSAGYARHRADFYVPNERPKRLWLRELVSHGRRQLRGPELPEDCRAGLVTAPSGVLPLNAAHVGSLFDVMRTAPDPRDTNTQYRTPAVMTLLAMALLAGRREIAEIARFATTLSQVQRRRLGLPLKKGTRAFPIEPLTADFPSARTLVVVRSHFTVKKSANTSTLVQANASRSCTNHDLKTKDHAGCVRIQFSPVNTEIAPPGRPGISISPWIAPGRTKLPPSQSASPVAPRRAVIWRGSSSSGRRPPAVAVHQCGAARCYDCSARRTTGFPAAGARVRRATAGCWRDHDAGGSTDLRPSGGRCAWRTGGLPEA